MVSIADRRAVTEFGSQWIWVRPSSAKVFDLEHAVDALPLARGWSHPRQDRGADPPCAVVKVPLNADPVLPLAYIRKDSSQPGAECAVW